MRIVALLMILLLPLVALAVPTGLNMMPTAESLGMGETRAEFESEGSGKLYVPSGNTLVGSQAGIILGIEGGIDQVPDTGTVYNLKWAFKGDGLIFPALAVGAQNIASGERPQYYVVATKSLLPMGVAKVHGGILRESDGDNVTMLGASARLGMLSAKVDTINGSFSHDGKALGVGVSINNFTISGTRYDYDNLPDETTFGVSYTYKPLRSPF